MTTYTRVMRLIVLMSRMERRIYASGLDVNLRTIYVKRSMRVFKRVAELVSRLQHDVNALNTALRDREESR